MWLGIDVGTTALRAGTARAGLRHLLADPFDQAFSIPTSVCLDGAGRWLIGRAAENARTQYPERFQSEFKRDLGTAEPYLMGARRVTAEQLLSVVLRWVRDEATGSLANGGEIDGAVIAVPATFAGYRRACLKRAVEAAGFSQVEIVDEPIAVVAQLPDSVEAALVLDFGGGGFSASALEREGKEWTHAARPVAVTGGGGSSFERVIFQDMVSRLPRIANVLAATNDHAAARVRDEVWQLCRRVKHQLTLASEASVWLTQTSPPCEYRLTREQFNRLVEPHLELSLLACAGLWKNLVRSGRASPLLVLVGGGGRMPVVAEVVKRILGVPAEVDPEPELAVVRGLTRQAEQRDATSPVRPPQPAARRPAPKPPRGKNIWDL